MCAHVDVSLARQISKAAEEILERRTMPPKDVDCHSGHGQTSPSWVLLVLPHLATLCCVLGGVALGEGASHGEVEKYPGFCGNAPRIKVDPGFLSGICSKLSNNLFFPGGIPSSSSGLEQDTANCVVGRCETPSQFAEEGMVAPRVVGLSACSCST